MIQNLMRQTIRTSRLLAGPLDQTVFDNGNPRNHLPMKGDKKLFSQKKIQLGYLEGLFWSDVHAVHDHKKVIFIILNLR